MDEFGVIGLGRMGGGLAHQALEKGLRVVGASRSGAPRDLVQAGLVEIRDFAAFRQELEAPRAVFLYIPAGPVVDKLLGKSPWGLCDIAVLEPAKPPIARGTAE